MLALCMSPNSAKHGTRSTPTACFAVWLWDPVVQTVLEQPTWLALGVLGAILLLLGRKKSRSPATQATDPPSNRR
jgi:hypothetical protein